MRIVFWTLAAAFLAASVEILSFLVVKLRPDRFDEREFVFSRFDPEEFLRFKRTSASPVLGWDIPENATRKGRDCSGREVTYSHGEGPVRLHGDRNPREALVLVAGDSFTYGAQAADDETYPATLERLLGARVANLGVPGYDPVQALLKLEGGIGRFPKARVAVLSIMYENTFRMMNGFRPVLYPRTGVRYGFKPHLRDGKFQGLPGGEPLRDYETMRKAAASAFDTDYWRLARPRFPYTLTLAETLTLPSFWIRLATKINLILGRPEMEPIHRTPSVRANLRALYRRFTDWTKANGIRGVIAFIPDGGGDLISGKLAISAATESQRRQIAFVNVDRNIDFKRFIPGPGCHPSPDGYRMIAENVARAVRPLLP